LVLLSLLVTLPSMLALALAPSLLRRLPLVVAFTAQLEKQRELMKSKETHIDGQIRAAEEVRRSSRAELGTLPLCLHTQSAACTLSSLPEWALIPPPPHRVVSCVSGCCQQYRSREFRRPTAAARPHYLDLLAGSFACVAFKGAF
jgi:hypothetical protein